MILSPVISMGTMYMLSSMITINLNPLASLAVPWTMPWPITAFIAGGLPLFALMMIVIVENFILYYPFFKIADHKALKEEQALAEE